MKGMRYGQLEQISIFLASSIFRHATFSRFPSMTTSSLDVIDYCDVIAAVERQGGLQCAKRIVGHLGPHGYGVVGLRGSPCVESLRLLLLPLAAQLANMERTNRNEVLKVEHCLRATHSRVIGHYIFSNSHAEQLLAHLRA